MIDDQLFSGKSTAELSRDLLGHELSYQTPAGILAGIIVEAEAYLGAKDSAAHAYKGRRTPANEALYGPPGTIYIYTLRGHHMLDIATQAQDQPEGILIRGLEPTQGQELMLKNRPQKNFNLTNGPGKLTQALGITSKELNLLLLSQSPLTISAQRIKEPAEIAATARINVSSRGDWTDKPLRFCVAHNPYVSQMRKSGMDLTNYGWQV
ncbi:DNA-3-methyladenine glycosylase [Lactobacillus sp. DCY120]|uniref:Putative 3-methyladenine DNA glycosylase n=2 Tax=Bombilactobacillus apium TaxID=2675299 RepID=A0A850R0U3_9LACO|nr:DNA-3-methyladenine glycosylase [Bombilactobacillus apium]